MASKRDIDTAIATLLWSTTDNDNGDDNLAKRYDASDLTDAARSAVAGLVDAINETRPENIDADDMTTADDDKSIHRGVLDVGGHGVGLWDDYHEAWNGHGKAWSDALRKDARCAGFRDCEGLIVGDDGKIHAYGRGQA